MNKKQPLIETEPGMHQIRSREFASNARSPVRSTQEACHIGPGKRLSLNKQHARSTRDGWVFKGMAGQQKNAQGNHIPLGVQTRSFSRPGLAIPRWVAPLQSPTLFHQTIPE
jgi:hypothetical protein